MRLEQGDYADLITYLSGLFSIKKVPQIMIDKFVIKYKSSIVLSGWGNGQEYEISRYPDKDERERMKSLTLIVDGLLDSAESQVTLNWESVEFLPDPDFQKAEELIDVLDRSTFRYF